jgi:nucleoside-diphosphate-sugar epimerase
MRIAITGASGWLGRATIATLLESGVQPNDIECFSSEKKSIRIENKEFQSHPLYELQNHQDIEVFVHLAFLTRDKASKADLSSYSSINQEITRLACNFIDRNKPRSVITISSGAVFDPPNYTTLAENFDFNPYGYLKIEEEKRLFDACLRSESNLVINRLWGLSGQDIQNVKPYALAEFIFKARTGSAIEVKSSHKVWRRYVDARELMALCLAVAASGSNSTFNSGGPLVEIGELAQLVVETLDSSSRIIRKFDVESGKPDNYYPNDQSYEDLLWKYLKINPLELKYQILKTNLAF